MQIAYANSCWFVFFKLIDVKFGFIFSFEVDQISIRTWVSCRNFEAIWPSFAREVVDNNQFKEFCKQVGKVNKLL